MKRYKTVRPVRSRGGLLGRTALTGVLSGLAAVALAGPVAAQGAGTGDAVVLSAVRVEERMEQDAAAGVVTIGQQQIDAEQPQSLKELFQGTPAVNVSGGAAAGQAVYVHGLDETNLNVTIDGATQKNDGWHHNGDLTIDPLFLKRADVYAGVAPADAGFGALGGSIEMETKDATDMLMPGQSYGGTLINSFDTDSATWNVTGSGYAALSGFEVLGMVSRKRGNNYTNGAREEERGTAANMYSGLGKVAYESPDGHRIEASGEHLVDAETRRLRPNMGVVSTDFNYNEARRTTVTVGYEDTKPEGLIDPEIKLYYNLATLERPNNSNYTRASGDFNSRNQSIGGKLQNTFAFGEKYMDATLVSGVDFYNDDRYVERFHFSSDVDENAWGAGFFNQLTASPLAGLQLSGGLRVDYQHFRSPDEVTFDRAGLSPNLSAEYAVTDWMSVFAGYSYVWGGMDAPELALWHARDYTYSQDLESTRAHNGRAGVRFAHSGFSLETSVFKTIIVDPLDYDSTNAVAINGSNITTQGVDLSASYTTDNARVAFAYTHADVTVGNRNATPSDQSYAQPTGDLITISGQYRIAPVDMVVGGSSQIAFALENDDLNAAGFAKIDGYTVINLFTEWTPEFLNRQATFRVEANNIFDETYYTRSTYSGTARVTPVYEQGRSFLLSSTLKF